jgi:hypothetical protein
LRTNTPRLQRQAAAEAAPKQTAAIMDKLVRAAEGTKTQPELQITCCGLHKQQLHACLLRQRILQTTAAAHPANHAVAKGVRLQHQTIQPQHTHHLTAKPEMSPLWSSSCTATTLHSLRSSSGSTCCGQSRSTSRAAGSTRHNGDKRCYSIRHSLVLKPKVLLKLQAMLLGLGA